MCVRYTHRAQHSRAEHNTHRYNIFMKTPPTVVVAVCCRHHVSESTDKHPYTFGRASEISCSRPSTHCVCSFILGKCVCVCVHTYVESCVICALLGSPLSLIREDPLTQFFVSASFCVSIVDVDGRRCRCIRCECCYFGAAFRFENRILIRNGLNWKNTLAKENLYAIFLPAVSLYLSHARISFLSLSNSAIAYVRIICTIMWTSF